MKPRSSSRSRRARVIDISAEMNAYFGLLRIGRELAIQGLIHDGLTKAGAVKEWARLERAEFARREEPPFSRRFPKARIWG